jgi:two-component system, cell cycle sensor histidine kinase and response regulator CckA
MLLLFGVAAAITGFVALYLIFFQTTRKTYPGFGHWTTGVCFLALGYLLYALRGHIPLWSSVFLGTVAFPLGLVFHLDGIRRFLGLRPASRLWYLVPVGVLAALAVFYFQWDSAVWRGLVASIPITAIHWTMAALLFRSAVSPRSTFYQVIGSLLGLGGLLILARAIWLISAPNSDLLWKAPLEFAFFTSFIVLHLGENLSLIMLNAERVERELLAAKDGLTQSVRGLEEALAKQKQTEESLRESEERYRTFFDTSRDAVFMTTLDGRFREFNEVALEMLGFAHSQREEVLGRQVSEFYAHPEQREAHAKIVAEKGFSKEFPVDLRRHDGTIIHTLITTVVRKSLQGNLIGFQGTVRDISDRKKAEEDLKVSEDKYRTVVEESFDGVFVQKGRFITFANSRLHKMLGYSSGEMEGLDHWLIYHPDYQGIIRERAQARLRGESVPQRYEISLLRKDGTSFPGEINAKVILFENEPGIQVWIRDLTEQKLLEQRLVEAQKMEAIGTLTGGIAHDFNNLLTIMNGYTEMILLETAEDDHRHEDLHKILETGRKGADLVQRLLALSKKGDSNPQRLNLNLVVENSRNLIDRTFPKMIQIETVLEKDLGMVNADAGQVEQVLMNLCINAKEAMPDGGRLRMETKRVSVNEDYCRAHAGAKPGPYVVIEVSDTGTGVSAETKDRIFDPFFTTKGWDFKKGTGLGLSVAKGIVEQHGGWITCESEQGGGTVFRVYFPVFKDSSAVRKPESPADSLQQGEKILLVDDEELVRGLAERILEREGYTIITASNGSEALEIYARDHSNIGLVVLDLIMPQMGGEKCLEELVKINPHVKVIVSSGHSLDERERLLLVAMAKGFVNKPYDLRQLLQTVDHVLEAGACAE